MRRSPGFTLVELMTVIAILGIMAAVTIASVTGIVSSGRHTALLDDQRSVQQVVDTFASDMHKGPDSTPRWGVTQARRYYPTATGRPGLLELSTVVFDPAKPKNPRADKFAAGPATGGAAADADIEGALVWMGLVSNAASGEVAGIENEFTGSAHPMDGERGLYLQNLPRTAHEANTDRDSIHTNGNGLTEGEFRFVLLSNARVAPVYQRGGVWYAAFENPALPPS